MGKWKGASLPCTAPQTIAHCILAIRWAISFCTRLRSYLCAPGVLERYCMYPRPSAMVWTGRPTTTPAVRDELPFWAVLSPRQSWALQPQVAPVEAGVYFPAPAYSRDKAGGNRQTNRSRRSVRTLGIFCCLFGRSWHQCAFFFIRFSGFAAAILGRYPQSVALGRSPRCRIGATAKLWPGAGTSRPPVGDQQHTVAEGFFSLQTEKRQFPETDFSRGGFSSGRYRFLSGVETHFPRAISQIDRRLVSEKGYRPHLLH